jgi:hypothetical protein
MGEALEFRILLKTLPEMGRRFSPTGDPDTGHVTVVVFPHLSEQGRGGETSRTPERRIHDVPATFEKIFPGASVRTASGLKGRELDYQDSNLFNFLRASWEELLPCNILVTHRNFLANEVLARIDGASAGNIPNAAVICLEVQRRGDPQTKTIFFVRHCTSHHNAARRGSGSMTTCADVSSLRRIAEELARRCGLQNTLYGSSVLPRAVMSCIALQKKVSDGELERVRLAFQPDAKALPHEIASYQASHACLNDSKSGSFCRGTKGTFILGSNGKFT